jgi:hypothetical protein
MTRIEQTVCGERGYKRTTEEVLCNDFIKKCASTYTYCVAFTREITDVLKTMGVYDMMHLTTDDISNYAHRLTFFFRTNEELQPRFFSLLRGLRCTDWGKPIFKEGDKTIFRDKPIFNEDEMFCIESYYKLIKFISETIYNKIKKRKEKLDMLNELMKAKLVKKETEITASNLKITFVMGTIEWQISKLRRDIDECKKDLEGIWNEQSNVCDEVPFEPTILDVEKNTCDYIYRFVMTNVDFLLSNNRLLFSPTKVIEKFLDAISF